METCKIFQGVQENPIYRTEICKISQEIGGNSTPCGRNWRNFFPLRRAPKPSPLRCATDPLREQSDSENRMFILGMGYVGQFFAQRLRRDGWVVSGTCRSVAKMKGLEDGGFNLYHFDANEPDLRVLDTIKDHTHLLVSIPPVGGVGDPMLQHEQTLRSKLMGANLCWVCYLSSTSVYGNCGGAWVDEDYSLHPARKSAKMRVEAEEGWLNMGKELGISGQIFRLGGIYGPGRSAVDTIIKQMSLTDAQRRRASRHYTPRVHVADICQALEASISKPKFGRIYNVVDDDPAPRSEVFAFAKKLINEKWPNQIGQCLSPSKGGANIRGDCCKDKGQVVESFEQKQDYDEEKRVSNARMKKELGVKLLHPSYKSGLQDVIDHIEKSSEST